MSSEAIMRTAKYLLNGSDIANINDVCKYTLVSNKAVEQGFAKINKTLQIILKEQQRLDKDIKEKITQVDGVVKLKFKDLKQSVANIEDEIVQVLGMLFNLEENLRECKCSKDFKRIRFQFEEVKDRCALLYSIDICRVKKEELQQIVKDELQKLKVEKEKKEEGRSNTQKILIGLGVAGIVVAPFFLIGGAFVGTAIAGSAASTGTTVGGAVVGGTVAGAMVTASGIRYMDLLETIDSTPLFENSIKEIESSYLNLDRELKAISETLDKQAEAVEDFEKKRGHFKNSLEKKESEYRERRRLKSGSNVGILE